MTTIAAIVLLVIVAVSFLIFLSENEQAVNSPTLKVNLNEELGNYLVDSKGRALYCFAQDKVGTKNSHPVSCCGEGCLGVWQIFYEEKILVSSPLKKSDFSNLERRQDEQNQTVYKGRPLYYYINDINHGDAKGEGMNNTWFVLRID